jgi:hypothetical protein
MKNWRQAIIDVLLWNYERGSWQYDVMCGLIVAFILLTPRSFFRGDFKHIEFSHSVLRDSPTRQASIVPHNEKKEGVIPIDRFKR